MMSISVTIIAWSLMPGIEVEAFTVDGLLVKTVDQHVEVSCGLVVNLC